MHDSLSEVGQQSNRNNPIKDNIVADCRACIIFKTVKNESYGAVNWNIWKQQLISYTII